MHRLGISRIPAMPCGPYIVVDHGNYLYKQFYELCSTDLTLFLPSLLHLVLFLCENPEKWTPLKPLP